MLCDNKIMGLRRLLKRRKPKTPFDSKGNKRVGKKGAGKKRVAPKIVEKERAEQETKLLAREGKKKKTEEKLKETKAHRAGHQKHKDRMESEEGEGQDDKAGKILKMPQMGRKKAA